jgi:hypothetical protein
VPTTEAKTIRLTYEESATVNIENEHKKGLKDTTIRNRFQQETTWRRRLVRKYPDMVAWWEKYAKKENLLPFRPRNGCEESRRYGK